MERAAHILQQLGKLYRRHRFQIRHRSRSLETKKDVSPMVWEKSIGIEKVGAAKWIKQSFLLGARYLDLMAAPSLHGLNTPAHLSPTRCHPLLMLFERVRLDESIARGVQRIGCNACKNLSRRGGTTI